MTDQTSAAATPNSSADASAGAQTVFGELSRQPLTGFVPLHCHTEHSKQDGVARVKALAKWANKHWHGEPNHAAIAMTDHGNIGGAWKFAQACKANDVKPIMGIEAYLALVPDGNHVDADATDAEGNLLNPVLAWDDPAVRFAKTVKMQPDAETGKVKRVAYNHLTILVRNETGWRNLCRIVNAAEDSFYRVPLIDYALLKKYGEGLIILSGCLGGPVASRVAMARSVDENGTTVWDQAILDEAASYLDHLIECVGRENVYVEVMEHGLGAEGFEHVLQLMKMAKKAGVDLAATNDSHYMDEHDCDAHDSWLVNGEKARGNDIRKTDEDRFKFNGHGYWMRTEDEMRAVWGTESTGYLSGLDKADAETRERFLARWQTAVSNTVHIAERIEPTVIPFKALRLPTFPVPADVIAEWEEGTSDSVARATKRGAKTASDLYLYRLVADGARDRYTDPASGKVKPEALERIFFELGVIFTLGLSDYFLIVWDAIAWCRSERGLPTAEHPEGVPGGKKRIIVGPGRGSAAGSAASYALRIVQVDPLRWGLLFERFLDIDRVGMPDIDVDFESARRSEIYDYLVAKYDRVDPVTGEPLHYVARIGAFQVAKTKRAIKDAARVLELESLGEALTKKVPVIQGSPQHFSTLFEEDRDDSGNIIANPEGQDFRDIVASDEDAQRVVELARSFEDVVAGEGIHAAGIVISDAPLNDLIPMRKDRKKGEVVSEVPIAWWDGKDIDSFGMLKLDALAIDNLDFLAAAVDHIKRTRGITVDPDDLPDADAHDNPMVEKAYEALRAGKTQGVFQMESDGLTQLTVQTAPTQFTDISALLALYRPGPMGAGMHEMFAERKNGRQATDYGIYTQDENEVEVIKSVVGDDLGLIFYQESMMALAGVVAGFDALQRSDLRKAISKKKKEEIDRLEGIFMEQGMREMTLADGSTKIAFAESTLVNLWATFRASAAYAFNKSHTVAYGYLSYITAYFKANYPVEYGAGVLGVSKKKADKRAAAIAALREEGIDVLGPDVNKSFADTAPDLDSPTAVRIGLTEIRDVGENGQHIIAERERSQRDFTSLHDLMYRTKTPDKDGAYTGKLSIAAVEALIEAGAFDGLGLTRLGLTLIARAQAPETEVSPETVGASEWSVLEKAARQRFRIGLALGEHPITAYLDEVKSHEFQPVEINGFQIPTARIQGLRKISTMDAGRFVTAGILTDWSVRTTRRGSKIAPFTLEGSNVSMSGIAFESTLKQIARDGLDMTPGAIVAVGGTVKTKTVVNVIVDDATGEETEETREIRELTADRFETIDIGEKKQPRIDISGPSNVIRIADRIGAARANPVDPATATPAKSPAKTAARTSTRTAAARPASNPPAPAVPEPVGAATIQSSDAGWTGVIWSGFTWVPGMNGELIDGSKAMFDEYLLAADTRAISREVNRQLAPPCPPPPAIWRFQGRGTHEGVNVLVVTRTTTKDEARRYAEAYGPGDPVWEESLDRTPRFEPGESGAWSGQYIEDLDPSTLLAGSDREQPTGWAPQVIEGGLSEAV